MKNLILILLTGIFFMSCNQTDKLAAQKQSGESITKSQNTSNLEKVVKTDAEWKEILSDQEFYVLRQKGTERAGTGDLLKN